MKRKTQPKSANSESMPQLQTSEIPYRKLVENSPEIIYIMDLATRKAIYLNRDTLLGYTLEELESAGSILSRVFPDDVERLKNHWRDVLNGVEAGPVEFRLQLKDGGWEWVVSRESIFARDSTGTPTQMLVMMNVITPRKQAEEALQRAYAYNRSLIEASLDPLVTIGPNGKINDVNTATEQFTGYTRAELIGTDFSDYFTDPAQARAGYQQVFREGTVRDYPLDIRHRAGHNVPVLYNAAIFRDATGEIIGIFAAARDITQIKKIQNELQKLNTILEQHVQERTADLKAANLALENALRVKDRFIAAMSHELRTPMNAILGFSQILLNEPEISDEDRQYLRTIHNSGEHLLTLINETLEMSKINEGEVSFQPMYFNLVTLIQEVRNKFLERASAKNLALQIDLAPGLSEHIISDENKIREILHQLLDNAIKFTRHGKIIVHCQTGKYPHAKGPKDLLLTIVVEDTGIGIPPEDFPRLFKAYEQTREEANSTSGTGFTGLGLAISQSYARLMGGEITVTSTPGVGSCFYVNLRVEESEKEDLHPVDKAVVSFDAIPVIPDTGELTSATIAAIPRDLIDQMKSATTNANFDVLLELIEKSSRYSPQAAKKLRELANEFQFDTLLNLYNQA